MEQPSSHFSQGANVILRRKNDTNVWGERGLALRCYWNGRRSGGCNGLSAAAHLLQGPFSLQEIASKRTLFIRRERLQVPGPWFYEIAQTQVRRDIVT
jgi:hypothetical protein